VCRGRATGRGGACRRAGPGPGALPHARARARPPHLVDAPQLLKQPLQRHLPQRLEAERADGAVLALARCGGGRATGFARGIRIAGVDWHTERGGGCGAGARRWILRGAAARRRGGVALARSPPAAARASQRWRGARTLQVLAAAAAAGARSHARTHAPSGCSRTPPPNGHSAPSQDARPPGASVAGARRILGASSAPPPMRGASGGRAASAARGSAAAARITRSAPLAIIVGPARGRPGGSRRQKRQAADLGSGARCGGRGAFAAGICTRAERPDPISAPAPLTRPRSPPPTRQCWPPAPSPPRRWRVPGAASRPGRP
jgi:hypothetical protein